MPIVIHQKNDAIDEPRSTLALNTEGPTRTQELKFEKAPGDNALPKLVGIKEATQFLRCSRSTLYRRMAEGCLTFYKMKGRLLFSVPTLLQYLEQHRVDPLNKTTTEPI